MKAAHIRVLVFSIAALVVLGASAATFASWWETRNFVAPGPSVSETIVFIEPGTSLTGIANELETAGAVDDAFLFRLGIARRDGATSLRAGEYAVPPRASMAGIFAILREGRVVQHPITIAEGLTSAQAVRVINANPVLTGDAVEAPAEGALLPETYLFERGTTRAQMLARMMDAPRQLLGMLWDNRAPNLPFDTPEEAINLASIVEKETSIPAERSRIAAVFVNRLRAGMRLESDPTIIYGLTGGEPLGHGLRVSELERPNPYSTYQIDGLPPTPICNPGRAAIAAVLNPPETNERFFVADGTGGHAFAETAAQHARNVAQWRVIERQSGAE